MVTGRMRHLYRDPRSRRPRAPRVDCRMTEQEPVPGTHNQKPETRNQELEPTSPTFSSVHHVNLTVTDLETSAEWYERVLGLNPGWTMDDIEGRGRKIILLVPETDLRIVLSKHQANDGKPSSEFQTGLDHIAFTVRDRATLDAWCERLDQLDVPRSSIKEGATGWLITFRDPDNIQLELYTLAK